MAVSGELVASTSTSLIFPDLRAERRDAVLGELARGIAAAIPALAAEQLERGFTEREELGSTALGKGLAVPHCKLAGIDKPCLAVGLTQSGVEFGAPDGLPVRVFMAVVSPPGTPSGHLRLLAAIARWARQPERVERILGARERAAILAGLEIGDGAA